MTQKRVNEAAVFFWEYADTGSFITNRIKNQFLRENLNQFKRLGNYTYKSFIKWHRLNLSDVFLIMEGTMSWKRIIWRKSIFMKLKKELNIHRLDDPSNIYISSQNFKGVGMETQMRAYCTIVLWQKKIKGWTPLNHLVSDTALEDRLDSWPKRLFNS